MTTNSDKIFLSLLLLFALTQQAAQVNLMLFSNIFIFLKISFWTFSRKNCISLALSAPFSLKPCKAFRIAQCKQSQLLKPRLNFDLCFIFKTSDRTLLETIVSYKPCPSLSQVNQKNSVIKRWKYRPKELLKAPFCYQKKIKIQAGSAWNFLQPPIQVCRGVYIPCFKIDAAIFCCPLFFEEHLNAQVKINKVVNKHTVDYHPSPSELTSTIHHIIFL